MTIHALLIGLSIEFDGSHLDIDGPLRAIVVSRLPDELPEMEVLIAFDRNGITKYRVSLSDPDGKTLWSDGFRVPRGDSRHRVVIIRIPSVTVMSEGDHLVTVTSGTATFSVPLEIFRRHADDEGHYPPDAGDRTVPDVDPR